LLSVAYISIFSLKPLKPPLFFRGLVGHNNCLFARPFTYGGLSNMKTAFLWLTITVLSSGVRAGTIAISDLTDSVTVTDNGSTNGRFALLTCPGTTESCSFSLSAPSGTTSFGITQDVNIFEDATLTSVSDTLQHVLTCGTPICFQFTSDGEAPLSALLGAASIVENGTFQTAITVNYFNPSSLIGTDTITFQSDVEPSPVPEPSSLLLLLTAVALLGAVRYRKQRA